MIFPALDPCCPASLLPVLFPLPPHHPLPTNKQDTEPVNHSALLTTLLLPALRLHLLPKLSVDVHLLVLEADSDAAVLSAGLTAASAAIADAGIPMSALAVGSVVVSIVLGSFFCTNVLHAGISVCMHKCEVTIRRSRDRTWFSGANVGNDFMHHPLITLLRAVVGRDGMGAGVGGKAVVNTVPLSFAPAPTSSRSKFLLPINTTS